VIYSTEARDIQRPAASVVAQRCYSACAVFGNFEL